MLVGFYRGLHALQVTRGRLPLPVPPPPLLAPPPLSPPARASCTA
jgi:hypothetical protein